MKPRIGVFPQREYASRKKLFSCLEHAFDVSFRGCDELTSSDSNAAIVFVDLAAGDAPDHGIPTLALPASESAGVATTSTITLADDPLLDRAICGRRLTENKLAIAREIAADNNESVFASIENSPIWTGTNTAAGPRWHSALSLPELGEGEPLRDRFREGRFANLLPVLQFLKTVGATTGWTEAPIRAAFLIDDPNLHTARYGYLRFAELAKHATVNDYHVAMATIPLDGWFASAGAVKIFQEAHSRLSLLIHGNNHVHHELASFPSDTAAVSSLAQALQRIEMLEQRTGLAVSRVMAPPHGECSEHSMSTMMRLGFDGICLSRPYPWLEGPPADMPMSGWFAADRVAGGFPVIPRYHLNKTRDDLVLRAFLGQPIVLYGHHEDCLTGLDVFADAAAQVHSLGDVQWCSLQEIATSNYATRRQAGCLQIRSYSNNIEVVVPDGVDKIELTTPPIHGEPAAVALSIDGAPARQVERTSAEREAGLGVAVAPGRLSISMNYGDVADLGAIPIPPWRPWPILRRLLTEGRDRVRPALGR